MGELQQNYQDPLNDEGQLYENNDQGLGTASANNNMEYIDEFDEDDAGDYFNGAIEQLATSKNEHDSGPFDDPLLRDTSGDGLTNDTNETIEHSQTSDIDYDHNDDGSAETRSTNELDGVEDGSTTGLDLLRGGEVTTKTGSNAAQLSHRHELRDSASTIHAEGNSLIGGLIWALVVVHVILILVLIAAWWRQKRSKDPTMRYFTPGPPQKVGCSYDMDKSYSLPKIELGNLPIKALKTLKQATS